MVQLQHFSQKIHFNLKIGFSGHMYSKADIPSIYIRAFCVMKTYVIRFVLNLFCFRDRLLLGQRFFRLLNLQLIFEFFPAKRFKVKH